MAEGIRLNAYISSCGVCSRRAADKLITSGRVFVNGKNSALGTLIGEGDEVTVDGSVIRPENLQIIIAVNKPVGVVCTEAHFKNEVTLSMIVNYPKRLFSIGRLDKNSTGLILMTNDGKLADKISKSKNHFEKEYEVKVNKLITKEFLEKMREGVEIEINEKKITTRPCKVKKTGPNTFNIILTQGLNRQIRRMCEALEFRVLSLRRIRVMNINLAGLNEGTYRRLKPEEIKELVNLTKEA